MHVRRFVSRSHRLLLNLVEPLERRRLLAAELSGMDLVDANTNLDISPLVNGTIVDLSTSDKKIAVQANVAAGATVGSVRWALDGNVFRAENSQPFAVANDVGGKLLPWNVSPGEHTLTVTPFNGANLSGGSGPSISATFTVLGAEDPPPPTGGPQLAGMTLINAVTNAPIGPLVNGTQIDLSSSSTKISVRGDVAAGSSVGSVQWALNGQVFRTENSQPFAVANDSGGKFLPWNVSPGQHTLTITPFSGAGATGTKGAAVSATFTVIGPSTNPGAATLSINNVSTNEGNSGTKSLVFTVTRDGDTSGVTTVNWSTQNSSAGEGDYQVASGSLTFAAGQTTKTISIGVKGDTKVENNEVFKVNLSGASGATIGDGQGEGTIVNDDHSTNPDDPTASIPRSLDRHEQFLDRIEDGPIGLLFIGDSITDWFDSTGASVYNSNYSQYDPANFGVSGDRTQNVIWRITNGELDGIDPDVVVLQIGTNNLATATDSKIADGIKKIVGIIRDKLPNTKILLLGIFPRGSATDSRRQRIKNINGMIDDLDDGGQHVKFLDIGNEFLNSSGNIPTDVMSDGLHPTAKGYQIWADAMRPTLESLLP